MAKEYEHLNLPEIKDVFSKKKRRGGGGYSLTKRDYEKFTKEQVSIFDTLSKKYQKEKEEFSNYSQDLVLKVKMNQPVHDDSFRTELRRADCDTLISQIGKTGEWLISTSDGDFTKLKKKLSRRKEKTKPDFVDAVESFQDFSFEDKIGPILRENPLGRIEVNKIILSRNRLAF